MKCTNCGFESQEEFTYCASCGTKVEINNEQTVTNKFLSILKDKLYLMFCIFLSVYCVFSIAGGAIPIIVILACVFGWIAYAKAQKDTLDYDQIKNLSGCLYAQYVITNVVTIICIVVGILLIVFAGALHTASDLIFSLANEFNIYLWDLGDTAQGVATLIGYIAGAVFLVVGIVLLLINILGVKKIHKFTKSIHTSIKTQVEDYKCITSAKKWLYFFAIVSGISLVSTLATNVINSISSIGYCGFLVVSICIIEKYFTNKTTK